MTVYSQALLQQLIMGILGALLSAVLFIVIFLDLLRKPGFKPGRSIVFKEGGLKSYYSRYRDRFARVLAALAISIFLNTYLIKTVWGLSWYLENYNHEVVVKLAAIIPMTISLFTQVVYGISVWIRYSCHGANYSQDDLKASGRIGQVVQAGIMLLGGLALGAGVFLVLKRLGIEIPFLRID